MDGRSILRPSSTEPFMALIAHLTTVHHVQDPRILHKEAASLAKADYTVYLLAQHGCEETIDGVKVLPLSPGGRKSGLKGVLLRIRRLFQCYRRVRALAPDLIHFHDPELIPVVRLMRRRTRCIIYDMHEDNATKGVVLGRLVRGLERWCFGWIDHLILAEDGYESIPAGYSVPRSFILNYYLPERAGVQTDVSEVPGTALLYTGNLSEERGLFRMLRLMRMAVAHQRAWHLTLVGICRLPAQRRKAVSYIDAHGLTEHVRLVGWKRYVPVQEMAPYYREATVGLALPSDNPNWTQSIPTKFYEYMHHGLPIICSGAPLWEDFVTRHDAGITVDFENDDAAFRGLTEFLGDRDRVEACREAARRHAPSFAWHVMEKRLLETYQRLLENRVARSMSL